MLGKPFSKAWVGIAIAIVLVVTCAFLISASFRKETLEEIPECKGCNVIIIELDSLGKGRLGAYGNQRNATPNIDAFIKESVSFREAYSGAAYTYDSDMSLFTGMRPTEHGAYRFYNKRLEGTEEWFDPNLPFLPKILASKGNYSSVAFPTGQSFSEDNFDKVGFSNESRELGSFEEALNASAEWLSEKGERGPFLLFVQGFDLHDPYYGKGGDYFSGKERFDSAYKDPDWKKSWLENGKDGFSLYNASTGKQIRPFKDSEIELLKEIYDGKLRELDRVFGNFIGFLEESGFSNNSIIIFTGEHGESFGENGIFGHGWVSPETIAVPLAVRFPSAKGGLALSGPTSTRLVYDMIKESVLGVPAPDSRNILKERARKYALSETLATSSDFSIKYYELGVFKANKAAVFGWNPSDKTVWPDRMYEGPRLVWSNPTYSNTAPEKYPEGLNFWEIERLRSEKGTKFSEYYEIYYEEHPILKESFFVV